MIERIRFFILIFTVSIELSIESNQCQDNSESSIEIDFKIADLIASYKENGRELQIEAFKLHENTRNLTVNNYGSLKWFSIGKPHLVETKNNDKKESIFHSTSNGFKAYIEMLTDEQRSLLARTASNKLKINSFEAGQIKNLILSCFKCKFSLHMSDDGAKSEIHGEVDVFDEFPLQIDFKMNQVEKNKFQQLLNEKHDFGLQCELQSRGFFKKTVLRTEKSLARIYKNDCINGGYRCSNGGTCLNSGLCACTFGYHGITCSEFQYPIGTILTISSNNVLNNFNTDGKGINEYNGWYLCDGRSGRPDLNGKVLVGYSKNSNDYNQIGKTGGLSHVSLNIQQLPAHTHDDSGHNHYVSLSTSSSGEHRHEYYIQNKEFFSSALIDETYSKFYFKDSDAQIFNTSSGGAHTHLVSGYSNTAYAKISNTGGNQPIENRQPYFVVAFIIFLG
jgi:microcystin-dependent protein